MRYTPYFLIISIFWLIVFFQPKSVSGQQLYSSPVQQDKDNRIANIEKLLSNLASESTSSGLNETANFSVSNTPIQDFLRGVAETHRLNVSIDPNLNLRITNNFTNVKVIDLLIYLCQEYQLDIYITGNIISFKKYVPPVVVKTFTPKRLQISYDQSSGLFTGDLRNDSLTTFVRQLTQISKRNIILAPGLASKMINGYVEAMPLEQAIDKLAFANSLKLFKTEDGAFVLQPVEAPEESKTSRSRKHDQGQNLSQRAASSNLGSDNDIFIEVKKDKDGIEYLNIDVANIPITTLINEVSTKANKNYVFFSDVPGNTTVKIARISYEDFLNFLLQGTSHTYRYSDGIYSIGNRTLEGFRTTRVVKMLYRPVDKIDELIPLELKKGIDIKIFKELNSVIFSGGAPQIQEIAQFLKEIDQPVLNVLIEVIVAEMRRGRNLKTGITAGLSDSLVRTSGVLFPGLDMTLSSRTINDFLTKLSSKGIINLGQVAPNFYATLQALEQNNFLDLKSTPKLATLNGHEANLTIGQSVYYLEQNQNITGGVNPITTVTQQFKQVSADLNIKINPMVSGDEHITLDISAQFSDFIDPVIQGAPPGNATRKFTSMIRIGNEEMIVLGGLEEIRRSKSNSGFPILSRIPILKWIFSSKNDSKNENRLVVFIKPTILY